MKDELEQLFKSLHLKKMAELFDEECKRAEKQKLSYQEFLLSVLAERRPACMLVTHDIGEAVLLGSGVSVLAGSPARIVRRFENPGKGDPGFRSSRAFQSLCAGIRDELAAWRLL